MTNAIVEPFNEFRVGDMGNVPTLRMWKHVNTVSLEWNDCGVIYDDLAFKNALDSEAMNAELNAIWRSHMSQCDRRRATFSWGIVGGHMDYVPRPSPSRPWTPSGGTTQWRWRR